jgi:CcmD family protein
MATTAALVACGSLTSLLAAQPPAGGAAPDGFVPVSQLPPSEQLPAAPLVMTAYAFIWVVLLVYVFLLWRRLGAVTKELDTLKRQLAGR